MAGFFGDATRMHGGKLGRKLSMGQSCKGETVYPSGVPCEVVDGEC
jgi:hypothetical protein